MPEEEMMSPPQTLAQLCEWIERYAGRIYVRERIGGAWGTYALDQLPAARALHYALQWIREAELRPSVTGRVVPAP